ncbi:YbaY family lipoprotein [Ruegeria sp. 2012CJ41-6]|uniref:YbaY family lipoprotein n=1 Tax=Ruegeria spongiae TaxID=2942209 RepID=A0ABT0Q056_9RHOB|nr:YbaY family lipoprotein [Ruegeria spongiae]MCL6283192.1 YbaY family lipoprotein [Ruegeria spongiae]
MLFRGLMAALLASATLGTAAMAGTIEGTATYRERIAVPPGAVLQVKLVDISRADTAAVELSAMRYALAGVPADFTLSYDEALIKDSHSYAVEASILLEEQLLFTSDTVHPVLTRGGTNTVDMVLVKTSRPEQAQALDNSKWQVSEMAGALVTAEKKPEIAFAEDGQFGATGGCNRFVGAAEIGARSIDFPDNMAGTLMACPPEQDAVEQQFLNGLTRTTGYVVNGDLLALTGASGDTVMRLTRIP